MSTILAVDTSTSVNTVSLCQRLPSSSEIALLAETVVECRRLHSERLLSTVEWVLQEAGVELDHIDALAVSIGPGSFTGLRIGVATWKGLAYGLQKPLLGIPTLDAMTHVMPLESGLLCPLLDARMKEVFGAVYRFAAGHREKVLPDCACPIETFLNTSPFSTLEGASPPVFLGDGARLYRERILAVLPSARFASGPLSLPRASAVALEAFARMDAGDPGDPGMVAPVYLRKSQAEILRDEKAGNA